MESKMRPILYVLFFFLAVMQVTAFEMHAGWQGEESKTVKIEDVNVFYRALNNEDIYVEITAQIPYIKNYTAHHPYISVYFNPWEFPLTPPHTDFGVKVCGTWNIQEFEEFDELCPQNASLKLNNFSIERHYFTEEDVIPANYTRYEIEIRDFNDTYGGAVSISLKYALKNYIKRQGNNYFVHLQYQNPSYVENIDSWFVFPDGNSFPTTIPDDIETERRVYPIADYANANFCFYGCLLRQDKTDQLIPLNNYGMEKNYSLLRNLGIVKSYSAGKSRTSKQYDFIWVFKFKGGNDRIFFYTNLDQVEQEQEWLQLKYALIGAIIGFVLSLLAMKLGRKIY